MAFLALECVVSVMIVHFQVSCKTLELPGNSILKALELYTEESKMFVSIRQFVVNFPKIQPPAFRPTPADT